MRFLSAVSVAAALAVVVAGCGGSGTAAKKADAPPHFRVNLISLAADNGFPAPASAHVSVVRGVNGKLFLHLSRLVPMPLPAPLTRRERGVTVCVPVILTVRLGDGHEHARVHAYRGCGRPESFRPLLRAMCPLLRRPGFCAKYRRELEPVKS